jgi:hypothetical protein
MPKTTTAETATAGACPRCHYPWRAVRRGELLFLLCNAAKCPMRRLVLDGYGGGPWVAVVAEGDVYRVLRIGGERECWDSLLRERRAGMLGVAAPLA